MTKKKNLTLASLYPTKHRNPYLCLLTLDFTWMQGQSPNLAQCSHSQPGTVLPS